VRFYRDVPREHPRTTETELAELPNRGAAPERQTGTPWRAMLVALFPVLIVDFCYGWLLWVYLTWLPSLFKDEFGLKLGQFALYTSLVLLAGVAGDLVGGRLSDELLRRRDPVVARRLPLVLGLTASLVCLAPVLVVHSLLATTISLALAFFFLELTNSTIWALPMDVAPDHAGAASGLVNTGFGIAGVISPSVVGIILERNGDDWRAPMLLSVVILGIGALCALRVDPRRRVTSTPAEA
jgi:MFS family permease